MIEILRTSDLEKICINKLIKAFKNNVKCCLLVDTDNTSLALSLKKKHFLMETYILDCFTKDNILFSFPNVHTVSDFSEVRIDDSKKDFFVGIVSCDKDNLDIFTEELLKTQQSIYFNTTPIETQYAYIIKPKQTFLVSRSAPSRKCLFENDVLNLFPQNYFQGKQPYTMVMSHGLALFTHSFNSEFFNINTEIIDRFEKYLSDNNVTFESDTGDLFINNKKFFGNAVTYTEKDGFKMSTSVSVLVTEFEPERDFFTNVLHYSGKNKYTGLIEEYNYLSYKDIVKNLIDIVINLVK